MTAGQNAATTVLGRWEDVAGSDWDALADDSEDATAFQSFGWLNAWWDVFGGGRQLYIVTQSHKGRLLAATAVFSDSKRPADLRFVGEGHNDYNGFLLRDNDPDVCRSLLEALMAIPGVRRLHAVEVPEQSLLGGLLAAGTTRAIQFDRTPCPRFQASEQSYARVLGKKKVRYYRRKIEQQGDLAVTHLTGRDLPAESLEALFAQHVDRWSGTPYPSLFEQKQDREFYRRFVGSTDLCDQVIWSELRLDRELIACHLGLLAGGTLYYYKPSFSLRHAQLSPGIVLVDEVLTWARDSGIEIVDFTRGDEQYKGRFATSTWQNASYTVYRSPFEYRAHSLLCGLKARLRATLRRIGLRVEAD